MIRPILLIAAFLFLPLLADATHIVGGRIFYECLGENSFRITMKIYRDCYNGEAPFDNPANVAIYRRSDNSLFDVLHIPLGSVTPIPVILDDPCLNAPPSLCVEEGLYTAVINLPTSSEGYILSYQRCCRNATIANLFNPSEQGATYFTVIPEVGGLLCNSSPVYKEWPPIAICANKTFVFDHSAIDPDGDSLVYEFCAPLKGASIADPIPGIPQAPPYQKVNFNTIRGFSEQYPLSSNPALKIDPHTGIITGKPTLPGQYVVGICVKEYRGNKLLGENIRDFQFNVSDCQKEVDAEIARAWPDTSLNNCKDFTIRFENLSSGSSRFFWDFGVESLNNDFSEKENPSYTYPDTGSYRVMLIAEPGGVCSDTDYISVRIYPLLKAGFRVENSCPSDSVPLIDISSNSYGPITAWHWDFGDGKESDSMNPVHRYTRDGDYTIRLTIENRYGCRDRHEEKIKIYPRPQSRFDVGTVCLDSLLPIQLRSKIDSGIIVARIWEPGDGNPPIQSSSIPAIRYHQPGSYLLRLIERSEQGCVDSFSREIIVRPRTVATAGPDTSICYGSPLRLFAEGGYYFEWTPPGQTANSSSVIFKPTKDTRYRVIVRDRCYADTAWVDVRVLPLPLLEVSGDTGILKGGHAVLRAMSNASGLFWSPSFTLDANRGPEVTARPERSTTYTVEAVSDDGCINKKSIRVEVLPDCYNLFIPNAFSPNGDGNNDYFYPVNLGDGKMISLSVYNRWGELVHFSSASELAWDGRHNGRYSPPGNYVYEITLDCQGQTLRVNGHLLLLR